MALSLRAVARELGMVSSAVYRYFPSRDDLLTALIVDAYDAVGRPAEAADPGGRGGDRRAVAGRGPGRSAAGPSPTPRSTPSSTAARCPATRRPPTPSTRRPGWRWRSLPSSGTGAPAASCPAAIRWRRPRRTVVADDFEALRSAAAPDVPDGVLARGLAVWTQLFGMISFELFGHLTNVINDFDDFFDLQMAQAARYLLGVG